jgi:hypothetical protein
MPCSKFCFICERNEHSSQYVNVLALAVVVKLLTLLLLVWEFLGSNLSLETSNPDWGFLWFSSVPLGECWDSTLTLCHDCSFQILSNSSNISFTYYPFIQCYIVFVTENASWSKSQTMYRLFFPMQRKDMSSALRLTHCWKSSHCGCQTTPPCVFQLCWWTFS